MPLPVPSTALLPPAPLPHHRHPRPTSSCPFVPPSEGLLRSNHKHSAPLGHSAHPGRPHSLSHQTCAGSSATPATAPALSARTLMSAPPAAAVITPAPALSDLVPRMPTSISTPVRVQALASLLADHPDRELVAFSSMVSHPVSLLAPMAASHWAALPSVIHPSYPIHHPLSG